MQPTGLDRPTHSHTSETHTYKRLQIEYLHCTFLFSPLFSPISWCPIVLVARTGSGETKVERHASSDTQPIQAARASNPEASCTNVSKETTCTWRPWLVRTARYLFFMQSYSILIDLFTKCLYFIGTGILKISICVMIG
jgi:hypothetical protein